MAINYATNTIYDPAGVVTTNTTALAVAFKTALLANAAYSLVEDVSNVGTNLYRWIVIKCAAASSGLGSDFYIVIYWIPTSSTALNVVIGESYAGAGTSGRTLTKLCLQNTSNTSYTPNADGTSTVAMTQNAAGAPAFSAGPTPPATTILGAASLTYTIVVYPDHFVLGSSVNGFGYYFGGFTSLVYNAASADPMPIVVATLQPANAAAGGICGTSRAPGCGGVPTTSAPWGIIAPIIYGNTAVAYTIAYPAAILSGLGFTNYDALQNSSVPLSEVLVAHYGGIFVTGFKTVGHLRGKYNNLRVLGQPPSGMSLGDTIVYNGTHWVCVGVVSGSIAAFADLGV